ncbi:MAG: aspartate/glutamate racemase family protein [Halobacteriovoraceae bacterium]|nr:aspartate/glutamate racemase family protein [Halobacteriovoraceae bacterium]
MKIALFDSGLGGLSVLNELNKYSYGFEIFYFADKEFHPYGQLKESQLIERTNNIAHHFYKIKADLIVVACNTATVNCISSLRVNYKIPFVGVEPYLNIVKHKKTNSVCLLATKRTCESPTLINKIKDTDIFIHPCLNLASAIEKFLIDQNYADLQAIIREDLSTVKGHFSDYILGCTHYGLIKDELENFLGGICHSTEIPVVKQILKILNFNSVQSYKENTIFFKEVLSDKWTTLRNNQFVARAALKSFVN